MSRPAATGLSSMIIVAGHLTVDPAGRAAYLADCEQVVRLAREAAGCLDFALSADLLDEGRINVYERWDSRPELETFRGSGPSDDQQDAILGASVEEYDVS
ncbi:putative quinol monooxygenase [Nocardioides sp.]|uniref:putative quinol monooxygenase n=1 Tax=Nocardioides sp. TaxID=35761 RepID=UPI0027222714|nr:antibiotic biosynthesis monooxygenase family protein [Nocardioides sp.]MDO9454999.1 antibiotic biosynthesis monooxygenase family protein [Nocardioides sp.]